MGISELDNYSGWSYTGEQDLAYFTLDPKSFWNSNNTMATSVVNAWNRYTNQTPGGNANISVSVGSVTQDFFQCLASLG